MSFLIVPEICDKGEAAALLGTKMADIAHPMGFTFCPYAPGTLEHYNFISGAVEAYFGHSELRGETHPWVRA